MRRRVIGLAHSGHQSTPVIKSAFSPECIRVKIENLIPLKVIERAVKDSKKYQQIVASARVVGLVEPPAIAKIESRPGHYYLVDGHLRIDALKELGVREVDCMIATDEDTYSYNKRVNRLSTIQDHKMIARAISLGVPEKRIAEALGLSVITVRKRSRLLAGICEQAATILKHGQGPIIVFDLFRKLKPSRQVQAAEFMRKHNDFSATTAKFLVASTEPHLLIPDGKKTTRAVTAQSMIEHEKELQVLRTRNKEDERQISSDAMNLDLIKNYLAKLLGRRSILHWLARNQRKYVEGLAQIAEVKVHLSKSVSRRVSNERERAHP